MKIARCSMYSNPLNMTDLISHTWLIDNDDDKNLIELLRYDCFGFSDATNGRQWGRLVAYSESYHRKIISDASLINETFEKIVKVKSELAKGNRNVNITMGLF